MATNNPGIRTKVMDVLKGFRTVDKIYNMKADEAITASMLCTVDTGELIKFDGDGTAPVMPLFALNNWFDDDANSLGNTTLGDGSGAGSRIIVVPAAGGVEIAVTAFDEADTTGYAVGDYVTAGVTAGNIRKAIATDVAVGIVSEVKTNAVCIWPIVNGPTLA